MAQKILIVEDNTDLAELYKMALEGAGYAVDIAGTAGKGLHQVQSEKYDLILLDIMLPDKNGIELLGELKSSLDSKEIPTFMLTVLGQDALIRDAFKLGAAGFFIKEQLTPGGVVNEIQKFFGSAANSTPEAKPE